MSHKCSLFSIMHYACIRARAPSIYTHTTYLYVKATQTNCINTREIVDTKNI